MIVCTMTALVVLTSGVFNAKTGAVADGLNDATLVGGAFNTVFSFGNIGQKFIAVAMFLFAFTTVLGWSHYGSKAWEYLFGAKTTIVFKIIHVCTVIFGAVLTSSLAWDISDTFNGLMMIPNLIGVVVLIPLVVKITKNYVDREIKGKNVEPLLSHEQLDNPPGGGPTVRLVEGYNYTSANPISPSHLSVTAPFRQGGLYYKEFK